MVNVHVDAAEAWRREATVLLGRAHVKAAIPSREEGARGLGVRRDGPVEGHDAALGREQRGDIVKEPRRARVTEVVEEPRQHHDIKERVAETSGGAPIGTSDVDEAERGTFAEAGARPREVSLVGVNADVGNALEVPEKSPRSAADVEDAKLGAAAGRSEHVALGDATSGAVGAERVLQPVVDAGEA